METDINSTNTSQPLPQTNQIPNQPIIEPRNNKLVKMLLYIICAVVFMAIGAFGFSFFTRSQSNTIVNNSNSNSNTILPTNTPTITTNLAEPFYTTVTKPNQQDKSKTDIYIKNSKTGEETLFITLSDVNTEHFHNSEYHKGNLYVVRRIGYDGYPDNDWADELWKYDSSKNGLKLFSLKGLQFLVAPDEKLIAIADSTSKLVLIDEKGTNIKEYVISQLSTVQADPREPAIGLNEWTTDSKNLWGNLFLGPIAQEFFQINTGVWNVSKYDVSSLSFGDEKALNSNIGKVAYSDFPALFDVDSANEFKASKKKVTLYIYDFNTKSNKVINTSIVKQFNPKWIDNNTLEYNDPNSEGRLTYSVQ